MSEICVTSFNISWDISNSITCGDVSYHSYEVSVSPPPIEGDAVTTTDNMFYNVTGLNNSLPNVTITVTARNRAGQGNNRTVFVKLPKPLGMDGQNNYHFYVHNCSYLLINAYIYVCICVTPQPSFG